MAPTASLWAPTCSRVLLPNQPRGFPESHFNRAHTPEFKFRQARTRVYGQTGPPSGLCCCYMLPSPVSAFLLTPVHTENRGREPLRVLSAEGPRRDGDQGLDIQDHLCNMNASGARQSHQRTYSRPGIPVAYLGPGS